MTDEQLVSLKRGREILALIDAQMARAARMLELENGQSPTPNVEEEVRLKALLRTLKDWAKQARAMALDVEKEFSADLPTIRSAFIAARKPIIDNPLLEAFMRGDLIDERPKPKPTPSQMPLENWPP